MMALPVSPCWYSKRSAKRSAAPRPVPSPPRRSATVGSMGPVSSQPSWSASSRLRIGGPMSRATTWLPPRAPASESRIRTTSPWTPYLTMFVASSDTAMASSVARLEPNPNCTASSCARLRAISTSPMARTGNMRSTGRGAPGSAKVLAWVPRSEGAVTVTRRTAALGLAHEVLDLLRLTEVELERVAQVAHRPHAGQIHPDVGQGLGDARVDAGQDAVGAEQPDRLGHLDEMVGGLRVHDVDAGDIDDRG